MTILTPANVADVLKNDTKVKVAGVDADGVLRGKIMIKSKFLSSVETGFGFSSAVFGWDMHDMLYQGGVDCAAKNGTYADFTAYPDLSSFRRLPWEDDIPFFLLTFYSEGKPVAACPRGLLKGLTERLAQKSYKALAGVELEFVNFQTPSEDGYSASANPRPNLAAFLSKNPPSAVRPLTEGMFGYSITRPMASKDYFYDIYTTAEKFRCDVEGWHTESGPGVYEAALAVRDVAEIADRVSLFKLLTRCVGIQHGATPCFMAKPLYGMPGSSGHIHLSLTDSAGKNLFARDEPNPSPLWPDLENVSDMGYHFLAGILDALPDIMPLLAPTVNSYKRFVENFWAPVWLTWGLEDRMASIRLIAPPTCKPGATRLEIRTPGADVHPHYALSALFLAGLRGVEEKLEVKVAPASARKPEDGRPEMLANSLEKALARFVAKESVARKLFGGEFVEFYAASREHELRQWREAVTDWEFKRYIETV